MKHCPDQSCPQRACDGIVAEFEDADTCSECGGPLLTGGVPSPPLDLRRVRTLRRLHRHSKFTLYTAWWSIIVGLLGHHYSFPILVVPACGIALVSALLLGYVTTRRCPSCNVHFFGEYVPAWRVLGKDPRCANCEIPLYGGLAGKSFESQTSVPTEEGRVNTTENSGNSGGD